MKAKSIYWQILRSFLSIVLVFIIFFIFMTNNLIKNRTNKMIVNLQQELITAKASEMSMWLKVRAEDLNILKENEYIKNFDIKNSVKYLKSIQIARKDVYDSFSITDLEGNTWVSDGSGFNIRNREYFNKVSKLYSGFNVSKPLISNSNKENIVIFTIPIFKESTADKIGYLNAAVLIDKLSEVVADIKIKDQRCWIMDNDSNTIIANYYNGYSINPLPMESMEIHQKDYIFLSNIENAPNWSLGINIPKEVVNGDADKLISIILFSGITICILIFIMCIIFTKKITNPITTLRNIMKEVQKGKFNHRFNEKSTYIEIQELGDSFNTMVETIDKLLNKIEYEQKIKREAELKALYSQIKPHFLYNTLDTIQYMALDHEAYDVMKAIEALTNIFRISLSDGKEIIKLKDEVKHIKSYLYIQKLRYEDKLNYQVNCEENLLDYCILKLTIQPLVENAIYHGIKFIKGEGFININIKEEYDNLIIEVIDNGIGMEEEILNKVNLYINSFRKEKHSPDSYGLLNVNERIKLAFGESYGIFIESKKYKGTKVKIVYPCLRKYLE